MAGRSSMLCPECRKLIHIEEPACPHCGARSPGLWGLTPKLQSLFGNQLDLVGVVATTCLVLYAVSLALDPKAALGGGGLMDFGSPSSRALYLLGMTGGLASYEGNWWTVFTATYLHGGVIHILFNTMWIRQLGPSAEEVFGKARFFLIYTAAGVGGFVLSNAWSGAPTIGASGAIFGLMGALAAFGKRRGGTVGRHLSRQMMTWAVILGIFGFVMPGVNNAAHAGGFIAGWIGGWITPPAERRQEGRVAQILALVMLVATAGALGVSIWRMWPVYNNWSALVG